MMKRKNLLRLLAVMMAAVLSVGFASCGGDDEEDDFGSTEQPVNQTPRISIVYSRVEYVNKTYTLEVTFGVSGIKEGQNVSVEMKYGTSYQNLKNSKKASRMNYSSDHYMCRMSNRKKGETIAFKGILTVDGKEVDSTSSTKRIN
jgi:hypothetical protein